MHEYLTDFSEYNTLPPVYLENPLTQEHVAEIRNILTEAEKTYGIVGSSHQSHHYQPRIMRNISRIVTEFKMPEHIEATISNHILPMYKKPIKLSHFSYLGYDGKYSDYEVPPALPPHIDAANTLLTFNFQLGGNIDWDIYVDGERHELKTGDALVFSAVNQVHWRPKRVWQKGDFTEILTVNFSPHDDWRFDPNGIDPLQAYPELIEEYRKALSQHPKMMAAWEIYNADGAKDGIPADKHGLIS